MELEIVVYVFGVLCLVAVVGAALLALMFGNPQ